jgi:Fic family protein
MNLKLETEFSKAPILQEVDALKKQIDDMRPLPADVEGRVMQKLRLDWNYNSNAIEGNKLSYGETVAFLMEGITAKGKPLKDHLDIRGHNEAINFLLDVVKDTRPISEADIRALHKMILVEPYEVKAQTTDGQPTTKRITLGEYKTSANHVQTATGETHYYATPEETPAKMQELMEWYNEVSINKEIHPVVAAALFHHKFVSIHPFDDGNGRLSRILMNLILMQQGYPPVVIKMDDRRNYYSLLNRADRAEGWPFVEYIVESLRTSLQVFLKAINGNDIGEEEDVDKEIALFKMELQNEMLFVEKRSEILLERIIEKDIKPLFKNLFSKAKEFDGFFSSNNKFMNYRITQNNRDEQINSMFRDNEWSPSKIEFNDCTLISVICRFNEFKNEKGFSTEIIWNVKFAPYNYIFVGFEGKELLIKYYHESITIQEQRNLIKAFIEDITLSIKKHL